MTDRLDVRPVRSRRELKQFIHLPWRIYRDWPLWVPPLIGEMKKTFNPRRNPFFEHGWIEPTLAWRNGRAVGRIAVIVNHLHNEVHQDKTAFWGFFEAEDDPEVFKALFDHAAEELSSRGYDRMWGPMNPSINSECGFLVEPFDLPPVLLMPYNPPYYPQHTEALGHRKCQDLLGYWIDDPFERANSEPIQRLRRMAKVARRKLPHVTVRTLDRRRLDEDTASLNALFNKAREHNWGFVPLTDEEFRERVREMRMIVDPEFMYLAEADGKVIGCLMGLPDINPILKKCNGRLLPLGWLHFLLGRRKCKGARLFGSALLPEYRQSGALALLFDMLTEKHPDLGYSPLECSWIAESNQRNLDTLTHLLALEPHKRYRVYTRDI